MLSAMLDRRSGLPRGATRRLLALIPALGLALGLALATAGDLHAKEEAALRSAWIDPTRIMVIYNTVKMDSVDPAEAETFSHDIGAWYMQRYGMPTKHLFGFDMGKKVRWNNPGALDFLQAVADYIDVNKIQVVLMAPGTPMIVRDANNKANLALDSLAGHALWFAKVKQEAPACENPKSIAPANTNLYFPFTDMGDGASPFVMGTRDATKWCPDGGSLIGQRGWYQTMMVDLRDHPSVRPFGRIGLPYYVEAFPNKSKDGKPTPELDIPLENSQFVKDLVNGGIAATTSIAEFNKQTERSLLFFGREGNTASFIDVESALYEALANDALGQGVAPERITRISPRGNWKKETCLPEPTWDGTSNDFLDGKLKTPITPLIFSGGGVGNLTEAKKPWPKSLDVQPGLLATASGSNGKAFSGSLLRRGATAMVVNIHHPQNSRLHAWVTVFQQLVNGATLAEAMITGGGSPRGGYISGSVWGDPLYAPLGKNPDAVKENWFLGGSIPPATPIRFLVRDPKDVRVPAGEKIIVSWGAVHLAATYRLERRVAGGEFEGVADSTAAVRWFVDENVAAGTVYEYRVRAANAAGESEWASLNATAPAAKPEATDDETKAE